MAQAQAQVARLDQLTDGLLDLSRIEAQADKAERTSLDLVDLLRRTSELYASQAEQAGIAFSLSLAEQSFSVVGSGEQLRRALGNLLDNAIRFTPEGGAVSAGVRREADGVEVWVQDTGIGIPADDLPQLFGRFHRGRNTAAYPGNGIGLAIVKAIVASHGGQVKAENISGGARFSMGLPWAN